MLTKMLTYHIEERTERLGGPRPGIGRVPTFVLPVAVLVLVSICLMMKSMLPALYVLVPLIAVACVVRTALACGKTRRSTDWDTLMTTPFSFSGLYLAEVSSHVRSAVLVSLALAGCMFFPLAFGLEDAPIIAVVLALSLWAHLAFALVGSTMTAGAIGMFRSSKTSSALAGLGGLVLHIAVFAGSVVVAGLILGIAAMGGLLGQGWDALGWFVILIWPVSLVGPWFALRIGPVIVGSADRKRIGGRHVTQATSSS